MICTVIFFNFAPVFEIEYMEDLLQHIKADALKGIPASVDDAMAIADRYTLSEIQAAADEVRSHWCADEIDTCSIANARSGRCPEDCKWCAQSAHYDTDAEVYDIIGRDEMLGLLRRMNERGVGRFSLVTSGRMVGTRQIEAFCNLFRDCRREAPAIGLCASMGLLDRSCMDALREAGVTRYHCNLETAESYFPELCTTHTRRDKLDTIRAAREAGMEVCSGGIIGMGETRRQRLELAEECRETGAVSIPVNILSPIPGTPLGGTPLISEEEVELTVALYRLIAPKTAIRFAGGRARVSEDATARMLRGGVNGAMVGDLLTTKGNRPDTDRELFARCGYKWINRNIQHKI